MEYTKEKEQEYYNKKLINETMKEEIKKPHKFDWKECVLLFVGLLLGFIITDIIGTDELISNKILRFTAEVFILFISISVVNIVAAVIKRLMTRK
jgi:hypothetical protein